MAPRRVRWQQVEKKSIGVGATGPNLTGEPCQGGKSQSPACWGGGWKEAVMRLTAGALGELRPPLQYSRLAPSVRVLAPAGRFLPSFIRTRRTFTSMFSFTGFSRRARGCRGLLYSPVWHLEGSGRAGATMEAPESDSSPSRRAIARARIGLPRR